LIIPRKPQAFRDPPDGPAVKSTDPP
jgi:hypothetical protein